MIVSNSSPLIALSRINRLNIFASLFGKVHIPLSVYQETVHETKLIEQRDRILAAIQTFNKYFAANWVQVSKAC